MPGDPGAIVVTNARAFYTTRAAVGARAPGIPHALCLGRMFRGNDSGAPRSEGAAACLDLVTRRANAGDSDRPPAVPIHPAQGQRARRGTEGPSRSPVAQSWRPPPSPTEA